MSSEGTSPQFPQGLPNDSEDVSWALSTGQAMWNRGDAVEAIRWLKRASDAASDAGADDRAFALARAAAELKLASGAGTVTPQPPEVQPPQPVIPAPPPPLASPNRPVAFAPPSRAPGPPSQMPGRPPTAPPPAAYTSDAEPAPSLRSQRPVASTMQSPAMSAPPGPARPSPSMTPPPGAVHGGPGATPSTRPRPPTATGSATPIPPAARPGGPVSQRTGTIQMSATPPAPPTPFPSAFPPPVSRTLGKSPSTSGMPAVTPPPPSAPASAPDSSPLGDADEDAGEATLINQMSPVVSPPVAPADPPLRLIDDVPTMARVQPFELTGALDNRPTAVPNPPRVPMSRPAAGTPAVPIPLSAHTDTTAVHHMVTPSAPSVAPQDDDALVVPPPRGPMPTPASAAVPAMRGWLHREGGAARVRPFTSPKPEGAIEIIILSADESVNLLEYLSS